MAGMPADLRIALTIVFLATGAFCLYHCVGRARSHGPRDRASYAADVLMSGSMVAMAWFPPKFVGAQMAVFAVAGGWFVVQAVGVSGTSLRSPDDRSDRARSGCASGRTRYLHHALVMAAMVWMFHVMSPGSTMAGMAGSPRPNGSPAATGTIARVGAAYCLVAVVLLLVACGLGVARGRSSRRASARNDAMHALMTAGMGAVLFAVA